jgi:hypothetical protein
VVLLRVLADVPFLPVVAATDEPRPPPGRRRFGQLAFGRRLL